MDHKAKFQTDAFIARWIAGDLTTAEATQFERWLEQNPKEKQYCNDLRAIWEDLGTLSLAQGKTQQERWARIEAATGLAQPSNGRVFHTREFTTHPLPELIAAIGSHFRVKIDVQLNLRDKTFSGKLPDSDLDGILQTLCAATGLRYKKTAGRSILIY